jgi:hypothetical protein
VSAGVEGDGDTGVGEREVGAAVDGTAAVGVGVGCFKSTKKNTFKPTIRTSRTASRA